MLAVKRPFGIPLLLTTLFLLTVTSIYLRDGVTTHFTKVSIFGEGFFLGEQESAPTTSNGLRLVVFGDSFAASTVEYGYEGKGASWTTTLCEQVRLGDNSHYARELIRRSSIASPCWTLRNTHVPHHFHQMSLMG